MGTRAQLAGLATLALTALTAIGCGGGFHATLQSDGLHAGHGQFVVEPTPTGRIGMPGWDLDNFSGRATKQGRDYRTEVAIDTDEDGRADLVRTEDLYDVLLVHGSTGARIWIRTVPTDHSLDARSSEALALSYVEAIGGGSFYEVDLGGRTEVRERRYATRLLENAACALDGIGGRVVEFEVRDVDRAQLDQEVEPDRLGVVVVVRAPYGWGVLPSGAEAHATSEFQAVLVIGLIGRPPDTTAAFDDFADLIRRIRVRGYQGEARTPGTTTCPDPGAT